MPVAPLAQHQRWHIGERTRTTCRPSSSPVNVQVAGAVASGGGAHHGPNAGGVGVADAAAGAGLGARVGRHGAGEVVGLCGEQHVPVALLREGGRAVGSVKEVASRVGGCIIGRAAEGGPL